MYVITSEGAKKKKKVCEIDCSKGIGCDGREVKISVQIWLFYTGRFQTASGGHSSVF